MNWQHSIPDGSDATVVSNIDGDPIGLTPYETTDVSNELNVVI